MKVLRFALGALLLTVVVIGGESALAIMVLHVDHSLMPARGLMSLAGFGVGLAVCIWLLRPGVRAFCAAQRRRRWGAWSLVWLAAGVGAAPAVGAVGFVGGIAVWQVLEIRACKIFIFPADSSRCMDWFEQCVAEAKLGGGVMTRTPCDFASYWPEPWRQLTYGPQPSDVFGQLERLMLERHTQKGWLDARDRHHVQAVADDWAEAWRLYEEGGLLAVTTQVKP